MDRGLKAPLSANEERTLRRVAQGLKSADLMPRDVARLHQLALIQSQSDGLVLTPLGCQRLNMVSAQANKRAAYIDDDVLPPARAAAQTRREADFRKFFNLD